MSDPNQQPGGFGPSPYAQGQPQPGYGYPGPEAGGQPAYGYPAPDAGAQPGYGYPAQPPAPGYPAPPAGAPYAAPAPYGAAQPANGLGTAGLVCGIIGVVLNVTVILWWAGIILGILAIIFGAVGRGKVKRGEATNKGAATSGLVLGIIATVLLPSIILLAFASFLGVAGAAS
ncbi:DUF4190 domain-containing protein [Streptomyces sp. C8S0]|uniref:DUF4190 domain-containing protein n=2 Tax=unclassified Streptomyces TaxID=2593676 RepID=UPI00125E5F70|nr:DUF4190 domain-containing protein [Streptomyces sp. C8S0]